jgi:hypothetical protein
MSTRSFAGCSTLGLLTWAILAAAGCNSEAEPNAPPPGGGPFGKFAEPDPPLDLTSGTPTIRQIMGKLAKGPNSLTPVLGKELKAETPDWGTIQPQTEEYARLASAMVQNKPRRGSPESWAKLSAAFADSANALHKAAQAKNRDAALEAHGELEGSCMECHREHRMMGRGMGKMGGPPPGDFPKRGNPG